MLDLFVRWPLLALAPAGFFWVFARWTQRAFAYAASFAWLSYAVYETLISQRVLCSGECDIRVDLLGIYPALAVVSIVALLIGLIGRRPIRPRLPSERTTHDPSS